MAHTVGEHDADDKHHPDLQLGVKLEKEVF